MVYALVAIPHCAYLHGGRHVHDREKGFNIRSRIQIDIGHAAAIGLGLLLRDTKLVRLKKQISRARVAGIGVHVLVDSPEEFERALYIADKRVHRLALHVHAFQGGALGAAYEVPALRYGYRFGRYALVIVQQYIETAVKVLYPRGRDKVFQFFVETPCEIFVIVVQLHEITESRFLRYAEAGVTGIDDRPAVACHSLVERLRNGGFVEYTYILLSVTRDIFSRLCVLVVYDKDDATRIAAFTEGIVGYHAVCTTMREDKNHEIIIPHHLPAPFYRIRPNPGSFSQNRFLSPCRSR